VSDSEQEEDKEREDHLCLDSAKEETNGVIVNSDNDVAHDVK